jgi:hypothetical protein
MILREREEDADFGRVGCSIYRGSLFGDGL